MSSVRTSFPRTRLSQLVERAGGIGRDLAVEGAMASVELLRGEGEETIARMMSAIDTALTSTRKGKLQPERLTEILQYADQIVTLAGTFGYEPLAKVMRSLCDVADGLNRAGLLDAAPIAVHVQSMHLLAPGGPTLSPEQIDTVLAELSKILTHYNFGSIDSHVASEDGAFAEPG